MLKNLRKKAPEKDRLGYKLFKYSKVSIFVALSINQLHMPSIPTGCSYYENERLNTKV